MGFLFESASAPPPPPQGEPLANWPATWPNGALGRLTEITTTELQDAAVRAVLQGFALTSVGWNSIHETPSTWKSLTDWYLANAPDLKILVEVEPEQGRDVGQTDPQDPNQMIGDKLDDVGGVWSVKDVTGRRVVHSEDDTNILWMLNRADPVTVGLPQVNSEWPRDWFARRIYELLIDQLNSGTSDYRQGIAGHNDQDAEWLFKNKSAAIVTLWSQGLVINTGDIVQYDLDEFSPSRQYQAADSGTTGASPPIHTSGTVSDGGVNWTHIGDEFDYPRPGLLYDTIAQPDYNQDQVAATPSNSALPLGISDFALAFRDKFAFRPADGLSWVNAADAGFWAEDIIGDATAWAAQSTNLVGTYDIAYWDRCRRWFIRQSFNVTGTSASNWFHQLYLLNSTLADVSNGAFERSLVSPTVQLPENTANGYGLLRVYHAMCLLTEIALPAFKDGVTFLPIKLDEAKIDLGDPIRTRLMGTLVTPNTTPLDWTLRAPDQTTPEGHPIFIEEFDNAIVIFNGQKPASGSWTADGINETLGSVLMPSAGAGNEWKFPDAATYVNATTGEAMLSQDLLVNDGSSVGATLLVAPWSSAILLRGTAPVAPSSWPVNYPNGQGHALQGNIGIQFVEPNLEWLARLDFFYTQGVRNNTQGQTTLPAEIAAYRVLYPNRDRNRWLTYQNFHSLPKEDEGAGSFKEPQFDVLWDEWNGEYVTRMGDGRFVAAHDNVSARTGTNIEGTIMNRNLDAVSTIGGKTWAQRVWEIKKGYFQTAGLMAEIMGFYKDIERWDFQKVYPAYHVTTIQSSADTTHAILTVTAPEDPTGHSLSWIGANGHHYAMKISAWNPGAKEVTLTAAHPDFAPAAGQSCWLIKNLNTTSVDIDVDGVDESSAECHSLLRLGVAAINDIGAAVFGTDLAHGWPRIGNAGGWFDQRSETPPVIPVDHELRNFHDMPMAENWATGRHGYELQTETTFFRQFGKSNDKIFLVLKVDKDGLRPVGENPAWGLPFVAAEVAFPMDSTATHEARGNAADFEKAMEAATFFWAECMMEEQVLPNFRRGDQNAAFSLDEACIDLGNPLQVRDIMPNYDRGTDLIGASGSIRAPDQAPLIYWEEFENAIVLVNLDQFPQGQFYETGVAPVVVNLPDPGPGKKWQRFDAQNYQHPTEADLYTMSQLPNKNNGLDCTGGTFGQVTMPRSSGYCVLRVDGTLGQGVLTTSAVNPLWFNYKGDTIALLGHQNIRPIQDNQFGRNHTALIENVNNSWTEYLQFMQDRNMNFIRMWTFHATGFERNTSDGGICTTHPWARSGTPGAAPDGGALFDLTDYNTVWWTRLEQMLTDCEAAGIIVAIMFYDVFSFRNNEGDNPDWFHGNVWNPDWNNNGVDADTDNLFWGIDGMYDNPTAPMIAVQDAWVEAVIDACNPHPNVMYEILNEGYGLANGWHHDVVDKIKAYQNPLPNQHPVWLSYGGREDDGNVTKMTLSECVTGAANNSDVFAPGGGNVGWGLGEQFQAENETDADGTPINAAGTFAGKTGVIDSDHGYSDEGRLDHPWRAICRGYNYNMYEPDAVAGGGWWGTWPYSILSNAPEENQRQNIKHIGELVNNRVADLSLMLATDSTAVCTTGYCLRNPGIEYICWTPVNANFTVGELLDGETYEYKFYRPFNQTEQAVGTQFVAIGSTQLFNPPYSDAAALYLVKVS